MIDYKYMIWSKENLKYLKKCGYVEVETLFLFPNIITIRGNNYFQDSIDIIDYPTEKFVTLQDIRDIKLNSILNH